ncbi:unnamed protein product [Cuscuta epithymum]|uniref:Uncharacterized protein n=1 Tax=Cuscuta epithymum TaxID=186058 RepID=A0AAV0D6G7_9ASTE|nr:unnamed protein product [Cuscuta epithymum]
MSVYAAEIVVNFIFSSRDLIVFHYNLLRCIVVHHHHYPSATKEVKLRQSRLQNHFEHMRFPGVGRVTLLCYGKRAPRSLYFKSERKEKKKRMTPHPGPQTLTGRHDGRM